MGAIANAIVVAAAVVVATATGAGCSAGGGGKLDGGPQERIVFDSRFPEVPPGCPPSAGNDKGVGAPCTRGGRQCSNNLACTCDDILGTTPPEGSPCFCTILSFQNCANAPAGFCGQDATCCTYTLGTITGSICAPDICLDADRACPAFSF